MHRISKAILLKLVSRWHNVNPISTHLHVLELGEMTKCFCCEALTVHCWCCVNSGEPQSVPGTSEPEPSTARAAQMHVLTASLLWFQHFPWCGQGVLQGPLCLKFFFLIILKGANFESYRLETLMRGFLKCHMFGPCLF